MTARELPPTSLEYASANEAQADYHHLDHLKRAVVAFRKDRPTLDVAHSLNPSQLFWLVWHEIKELNGSDKYGYFARPEQLGEYRQQELADIIIYLQELYDRTASTEGNMVFADENLILSMAAEISQENSITVVGLNEPLEEPGVLNSSQEKTYNQLRERLNLWAEYLDPAKPEAWKKLNRDQQELALNEIMATSFAMMYMYGINPLKAAFEKVSRNILRYDAMLLQDDFSDILNDGSLSPEERDMLISRRYDAAIEACKTQFDGAAAFNEESGLVERPQYGTVDFYSGMLYLEYLKAIKVESNGDENHGTLELDINKHPEEVVIFQQPLPVN